MKTWWWWRIWLSALLQLNISPQSVHSSAACLLKAGEGAAWSWCASHVTEPGRHIQSRRSRGQDKFSSVCQRLKRLLAGTGALVVVLPRWGTNQCWHLCGFDLLKSINYANRFCYCLRSSHVQSRLKTQDHSSLQCSDNGVEEGSQFASRSKTNKYHTVFAKLIKICVLSYSIFLCGNKHVDSCFSVNTQNTF